MSASIKPPTARPCATCPYRQDVPSGVWAVEEYGKLPAYDLETWAQPTAVFLCHQRNGHLCSGWVGCHDMQESLAFRVAVSDGSLAGEDIDAVLDYVCPVPLFESGAEAAEHGLADVDRPDDGARAAIRKLQATRGAA